MTIYQINCGSNSGLSGWNNDPDAAATTTSALIDSTGATTAVTYENPAWDSIQSNGLTHADLPANVWASYLKWYGGQRTIKFGGLNNAKTYTLALYSTAPGALSVNWTSGAGFGASGGTTQALARGSKATWTGLAPSGGYLFTYCAVTASGSDATLSAIILTEEGAGGGAAARRRVLMIIT